MKMTNCEICSQNRDFNKIIYETENWIITSGPIESQINGYLYMSPKRHVENWFEFNENELLELGPIIKKIEIAIKEEVHLERLYTVTISEAMRHIHIHLIPREEDNEVKGLSLIEQATSKNNKTNKKYSINEIKYTLENIKKRMLII